MEGWIQIEAVFLPGTFMHMGDNTRLLQLQYNLPKRTTMNITNGTLICSSLAESCIIKPLQATPSLKLYSSAFSKGNIYCGSEYYHCKN
jgi:hypothetical protein